MAATGIVGTGTFLAVNFSKLPLYGDSLDSFARWAPSHRVEAGHAIGLLFLTYLLYMVFAVYVANLVAGGAGWALLMARVALTAVGTRFAIEITQLTFLSAAASNLLSPGNSSPVSFAGALGIFASQLAVTSLVPYMVFLGAVGVAMLASHVVPVWLAWTTLAVAAIHAWAFLAVTVGVPVGPLGFVWYASIFGWPLIASVTLCVFTITRRETAALP